jgi:S1-C subfamily serine protease
MDQHKHCYSKEEARKMKLLKQLGIMVYFAVILVLLACATPYKKQGILPGYQDENIGGNRWHISIKGNAFTSIGDIEQHFYRRAQEIVKENGYDGYVVERLEKGQSYFASGGIGGNHPRVWGTILCYKGSSPSNGSIQTPSESSGGRGTGWMVARGYVATNNHVVQNSKKVYLILSNGSKVNAHVVARDQANDLAILSFDEKKITAPVIPIADTQANVGTHVFAIGYPITNMMGASPKVTDGIVSAATGVQDDPRLYQISVPLQSGNSGGPLLNMKGEVVGVVSYKLDAATVFQWTGNLPENVNYAVKAQYLEPLIKSITGIAMESNKRNNESLEILSKKIMPSVFIVVVE